MDTRILLKYNPSKCNNELIRFLNQNIEKIKKKLSLKIIIVYDDLIPLLVNNIKKLPLLINKDVSITGNTAIMHQLLKSIEDSNTNYKLPKDKEDYDLEKYWNKEMHSGVDDEVDEADDLMNSVKRQAFDQSIQHRDRIKTEPKKKSPITPNTRQDNIKLENINSDKISDMLDDDPMMKRFWENRESTPGF
jgi:hypothetical protein